MEDRYQRVGLMIVGALLLWVLTNVMQSSAQEGPDRSNLVQVPLVLMVLGTPLLAYLLRRRPRWLRILLLVVQLVLYVIYDTGISIGDIRGDLMIIYPAILLTAWMALRPDFAKTGG